MDSVEVYTNDNGYRAADIYPYDSWVTRYPNDTRWYIEDHKGNTARFEVEDIDRVIAALLATKADYEIECEHKES